MIKEKYRVSKNPIDSTLNDLKVFEQRQYCFDYIKENSQGKTDDEISQHAIISSACFRQASEYLTASNNVSLSTKPLLLSYALNNLLKGVCYLKSFDNDILIGFTDHGFKVQDKNIKKSILNSKINIKQHGAVISLLKLFGNELNSQEIDFNKLLRHIPGIEDIYFKTTNIISLVSIQNKNDNSQYLIVGDKLNDEIKEIMKEFGLICNIDTRSNSCICYTNMKCKQKIKDGTYDEGNLFYQDYLILPEKFEEGIKDINIVFYCYLLIMSYGMLVRYNAHMWEEFIDKKTSKESTLIELSIENATYNFYAQLHYLIYGYYYKVDEYNDLRVKRVINDSTTTIMNNITKEIEHHNLQYNSHELLPWSKNYR